MGRYFVMVLFTCLIFYPSLTIGAEAEKPLQVPRLFGTFAPKPGVWSEYAVFDKATGKRSVMRMSIVGVDGDFFWYEVVNKEGDSSNIVKMLVKGDPNDPENILRLIMKSGGNPAQEMPRDFVVMGRRMAGHMFAQRSGIPANPRTKLRNIRTGEGVVTVPAGTFDVDLHQIVDSDGRVYAQYKFSREVGPFGVVASEAESTTMVLAGHGTGAESRINEEPVMMTQPPGMPQGMPMGMPPGMAPPRDTGTGARNKIRQIPGMGSGYEPADR
ncbi:MAG: hypothetical protein R3297_05450 [Desulfobulbales bacterium]|nr:hypothetical protein [Desulfobulbales bacterium]